MQSEPVPIPLERRAVTDRLGRLYRHGRLLRRLLRLLEEAERQGLPLTTADRLDVPLAPETLTGARHAR